MYNKLLLNTLIDQEKRAAQLFLILLLSVVFCIDMVNYFFLSSIGSYLFFIPYGAMFLCLPLAIYYIKINNPRRIKYIFFAVFSITNLVVELIMFWHIEKYTGGNLAEIYFVLFSPIFVNKRYFKFVTIVTFSKFAIIGLVFYAADVFLPITVLFVVSVITLIILHRFSGYMQAMNSSYFQQFEGIVKGIISTLELKDPYTRGHSHRVAEYSVILAEALDIYNENDLKLIYHACLLHDVGKVHTPDSILSKPGKLTKDEYEIVKQHPQLGAQAIKGIHGMELCMDIVLYHHERWDGQGYPEGLRETQIPITARITAIADSFDAMTSKRSYREAMTADEAYHQIISGKGTQFDPALVEYFETVFDKWKEILEQSRKADVQTAV